MNGSFIELAELLLPGPIVPRWVEIADAHELAPGEGRECVVEDRIIALYNVDGSYFAMDGICPHQGGPLGKGCLVGSTVTCPWHGWQFDVSTGRHQLSPRLLQPRFDTEVRAGKICVAID